ncbi:MAG: enoyl-CoA hydratase/isomerase family protein [Candidatus Sericytochromatia bacterium]
MSDESNSLVLYEIRDRAAWLTINRPERHNALSVPLMESLTAQLGRAAADPEARVVVLTGSGGRAFCAGADIDGFFNETQGSVSDHAFKEQLVQLFELMTGLGKPTIGRINGLALGGGFGLAMACDLAIASDNASFGTPEANIGLFPMVIMTVLYRNIPRKKLLELMYTGEKLSAAAALELGMINSVVPADQLDAAISALVGKIASKSGMTLRLGREAFYTMADLPMPAALSYLKQMLSQNLHTHDAREGLQAFLEKRPPQWQDK